MITAFAIGVILVVGATIAIWRDMRFRRTALSLQWPASLSPRAARRYTKCYLRRTGWKILDPWDLIDIEPRAMKEGEILNIWIVDPALMSLETRLRDASEVAESMSTLITLIDIGFDLARTKHVECPNKVIFMQPKELPQALALVRSRRLRVAADAEKSRAPVGPSVE